MKIVITGFMGSGKSRVARELAQRLNVEFVDLDERITGRVGRSPAQLIVVEGEETFRSIETQVLRELLETETARVIARVIALGGGAWIQETNRALINQCGYLSVWLDVPFEVCWARIEASGEDRPLGRSKDQAQALYDRRRSVYQLADLRIEVGDLTFEDVILTLITRLRS